MIEKGETMNKVNTKKIFAFLSICTVLVTILSACSSKNTFISEIGTWKMESVANSDGQIIANSNNDDYDLACIFMEDNTFSISNGANESWTGTYTKVDAENAISLTLQFSDKSTAQGVCGKREYDNGDVVDSLIITTNDRIISFLRGPS